MSYLLDKKIKRKKFLNIFLFVVFLCVLIYFRSFVFNKFSIFSHFIFQPVLFVGNSVGEKFSNVGAYFSFKSSLLEEKQNALNMLEEKMSLYSNYASVLDENIKMKEILGRKDIKNNIILSSILSKPNRSLYDSLVVDVGGEDGIVLGARVFAFGNVPIGKIAEVYKHSSKVILFSNPGEKTEVVINGLPNQKVSKPASTGQGGNIFMQIVGRGGGNFEMAAIKDLVLEKGTEVVLPGINPYILATVETTISDPRDSFDKVLLVSPVNIQELKFVEIEK